MVGKIIGTVAFLSMLAVLWLLLWQARFSLPACVSALVAFLVIGAFATIEPGDWRKREPKP